MIVAGVLELAAEKSVRHDFHSPSAWAATVHGTWSAMLGQSHFCNQRKQEHHTE
jgi:hypothetical protein